MVNALGKSYYYIMFEASYVFLAGGIGITPFRSMLKELVDAGMKRDILFIYSTSTPQDILFQDVLHAAKGVGVTVIYLHKERVTSGLLAKYLPNPLAPVYYISGPQGMVLSYQEMLMGLGIPTENIKTDSFTGYD